MDLAKVIEQSLTPPTIAFIAVILLFTLVGIIWKRHSTAASNLVTVLGILGTFIGIWYGLAGFDTQNIQAGIPQLLEGMKLAFTTSIVGMVCSIIIRSWSMAARDKTENPADVSIVTLAELLREIRDNQNDYSKQQQSAFAAFTETVNASFGKLVTSICGDGDATLLTQIQKFRTSVNDKQDEMRQVITEKNNQLIQEFHDFATTMAENNSKALIEALSGVIRDFNTKISEQFGENFKQLNEAVGNLLVWQKGYKESLDDMMTVYRSLVSSMVEIRDSMNEITLRAGSLVDASEKLSTLLTAFEQVKNELHNHLEAFSRLKDEAHNAFPIIERNLIQLTTGFTEHTNSILSHNQRVLESQSSSYDSLQKGIADVSKTFGDKVTASMEANQSVVQKQEAHYDQLREKVASMIEGNSKLLDNMHKSTAKTIQDTSTSYESYSNKIRELLVGSIASLNKEAEGFVRDCIASMSQQQEISQEALRKNGQMAEKLTHENAEILKNQVKQLDDMLQQELTKSLNTLGSQLASLSNRFVEDYTPLTEKLAKIINITNGLDRR